MGIGAILSWPIGVLVARRTQKNTGGVPQLPYQRFFHDFYNVNPTYVARKKFRINFYATILFGGFLFAHLTTDRNYTKDFWHSRPDFKPYPAMMPDEYM